MTPPSTEKLIAITPEQMDTALNTGVCPLCCASGTASTTFDGARRFDCNHCPLSFEPAVVTVIPLQGISVPDELDRFVAEQITRVIELQRTARAPAPEGSTREFTTANSHELAGELRAWARMQTRIRSGK